MKRVIIARILVTTICFLLFGSADIHGLASGGTVPAIDGVAFEQALRDDRLALVPMEAAGLLAHAQPLSLSPDGEKLLALSEDGLSVFSLADGSRTPLRPRGGDSHLTEDQMLKLFSAPEVTATSWSADGRYLSFSFPGNVYMRMFAGSNVWVADIDAGVIDPLFDLPEGVSMVDLYGDNAPRIPIRAAFDPHQPVLYYDLLTADEADEDAPLKNRYFQWNYETGETVPVGETPFCMSSGDPKLQLAGDYLITTVAYNGGITGGAGIAALADAGTSTSTLAKDGFLAAFLYGARLIATHESDAVLYQRGSGYELAYGYNESSRQIIRLLECSLNNQGEALYGAVLATESNAPPQTRLLRLSPEELDGDEANTALFQRYMRGDIDMCRNAVFSPDGGYLLLATHGSDGSKGLYVYNPATGECGRVTLPDDFEAKLDATAFAYEAGPYKLPGIQWSAGGRLLLCDGKMNHLYALAVEP